MKEMHQPSVTEHAVISKIYIIRDQKVMLDKDLAELYQVSTKVLNQAVRRNPERFPDDFMFRLTSKEQEPFLRSQNVTSKPGRGGTRYLPAAFTEQGVAMLSSVLNSKPAIAVNIQIIRIFTKMREMMLTHKDILLHLEKIEQQVGRHDEKIKAIFECMKNLLNPDQPPRARVGFRRNNEKD